MLQFHWPDRYIPLFGAPHYLHELERQDATPIREQLEIIDELIKSGKVRHFGLSNETPFGVTAFAETAKLLGLPRVSTTQNVFNLLERNDFETGMIEACSPANANIGLLAYSPLAGGALSGKYLDKKSASNENSRMRQYIGYMYRYIAGPSAIAIKKYLEAADVISVPLAPLALSWVYSRPFVTSTIIGATNLKQLEENVLALNLPIADEIKNLIDQVYQQYRDPSKGTFEIVDPDQDYIDPSKLPWGAKDQEVDPELDIIINQRLSKF